MILTSRWSIFGLTFLWKFPHSLYEILIYSSPAFIFNDLIVRDILPISLSISNFLHNLFYHLSNPFNQAAFYGIFIDFQRTDRCFETRGWFFEILVVRWAWWRPWRAWWRSVRGRYARGSTISGVIVVGQVLSFYATGRGPYSGIGTVAVPRVGRIVAGGRWWGWGCSIDGWSWIHRHAWENENSRLVCFGKRGEILIEYYYLPIGAGMPPFLKNCTAMKPTTRRIASFESTKAFRALRPIMATKIGIKAFNLSFKRSRKGSRSFFLRRPRAWLVATALSLNSMSRSARLLLGRYFKLASTNGMSIP